MRGGTIAGKVVYAALKESLREAISSGELPPGGAIPGENALAERHGISRSSVRMALGELERDGLIVKKPGKGSFVRGDEAPYANAIPTIGTDISLNDSADNWYASHILRGIREVCDREGCRVAYCGGPLDACRKGFYDAVVLLGTQPQDYPAIERLPELGVYPALVNRIVASPGVSYVAVDYRRESERAAASLFDAGCRRVGIISGRIDDSVVNRPRLEGFLASAKARGLEGPAALHLVQRDKDSAFYTNDILEFLRQNSLDALYLFNGSLAQPLITALDRIGAAPEKCPKLLCFDDIGHLAPFCHYAFTYVKMPLHQMGRDAAAHLIERIRDGKKAPVLKKTYQAELVNNSATLTG